jgi:large subunit ribosomal protein L18
MTTNTLKKLNRRRARVRATVTGTTDRPRLSVKITLRHVVAQVIDDSKGKTLAYVTTVSHKDAKGNMTERAALVGTQVADAAKKVKVKRVVFDRNGRIYHGRLAALADAARKEGLEF